MGLVRYPQRLLRVICWIFVEYCGPRGNDPVFSESVAVIGDVEIVACDELRIGFR